MSLNSERVKRAWKDPQKRINMLIGKWGNGVEKHAQSMKDAWQNPEKRKNFLKGRDKSGRYLSLDEKNKVIEEIKNGRSYLDISIDWLLSPSHVAAIARSIGIHKGKSRKL